jgi:nicotinamidase-related amidase
MYTLVVVDMQDEFVASRNKRVQEACKKAIKRAIRNKSPIVFLEYVGYGPTLPSLTKLTRNYPKVFHASKNDWDGSRESLKALTRNKIEHSKFKICGVYTDCCVAATANGLIDKCPAFKVEVLSKACWATDSKYHKNGLAKMSGYNKRIRIINK